MSCLRIQAIVALFAAIFYIFFSAHTHATQYTFILAYFAIDFALPSLLYVIFRRCCRKIFSHVERPSKNRSIFGFALPPLKATKPANAVQPRRHTLPQHYTHTNVHMCVCMCARALFRQNSTILDLVIACLIS